MSGSDHLDRSLEERLDRAAALIAAADVLLIGAGAGLSAAAGYDFTSRARFAHDYPGMLQYGFSHKLQMMANFGVGEPLLWGYYLQNVAETRFDAANQHRGYQELRALTALFGDWFVVTTNVDSLFERNGFETSRLYTPQGDYGLGQCRGPCSADTWSSRPWIETLLPAVDRATQLLPQELIPSCPHCGGPVFFNVRCASWFVDEPWLPGRLAFEQWLSHHQGDRILALDIGSGFNTPMWVRWPLERLALSSQRHGLIRINRDAPQLPDGLGERGVAFSDDPGAVLQALLQRL